ncbi:exosortase X [Nafulsella turpanensis]|uniref:exosortase X n=1 Tax=Nafulsella turpanensis TaxID=1265690 RepID=UPI00037AAFCD|nr:archaeosortase/exosortase family protein [Nafulsella turpanensis]
MQNKKLILFVVKALGLLLLWIFGYELWLKGEGTVDNWLTSLAAAHSSVVFSWMDIPIVNQLTSYGEAMVVAGNPLLYIAHSCNGLVLYAMFAGFILLFGKQWGKKLAFIGGGLLLIYAMNIARIVLLCLIQLHYPNWLDISHKYIFTILIYAAIFLMWMKWVNMQPVPQKKSPGTKNAHV